MKKIVFLFLSIIFCFFCQIVFSGTNCVPVEVFYVYDKHLPLNMEVKLVKDLPSAKVEEIFFDTVNNLRISGLLVTPKTGLKKYPVLLYLHGSGMSRDLPDLAIPIITQEGYAIFSISAMYTNERRPQGKSLSSGYLFENKQGIIQTIIDYRRGIDCLEKIPAIDTNRIGILGLSLGTIQGSILFSVDKRIKVAIFAVGGGDMELMTKKSILLSHFFDLSKSNYDISQLRYVAAPIDPINFAQNSKGRPVLMVNGRRDEIIPPECARKLYETFEEPKHIIWYDGGHVPSMDIIMTLVKRTLTWFRNYLKPETLPVVSKRASLEIKSIDAKPNPLTQGNQIKIEAKTKERNNNIIFVKVYIEADDAECLLYDDGTQGGDKIAGDGIYTGRARISYNSKTGQSRIIAKAVDYEGNVSQEITNYIFILPYQIPVGAKPPQIEKVSVPEKIKIGSKVVIEVVAIDENDDIDRVEANVMQFGLPVLLERIGTTNTYKFEMEIPDIEDIIKPGKYDISVTAKDKTQLVSERKIIEITLER